MKTFFAFDGIDGCGKTTIIKLLEEKLLNNTSLPIKVIYESDHPLAQSAKFGNLGVDHNTDMFLFWAARYSQESIRQDITRGVILNDRYYDTTYVYRNEKFNKNPQIFKFNYSNVFSTPIITFILDVDPEIALQRSSQDESDRFNQIDYEKAKERRLLYSKLPKLFIKRCFEIIDTSKLTVTQVTNHCYSIIQKVLNGTYHRSI